MNKLKIFNSIALIAVLGVNYLANALPINGILTGAISDKYFNEFAPAGITFSIWGVIYLLLITVIIWQFIGRNGLKETAIKKISPFFILNCGLNALWLFLWHYQLLGISVLVMLGILYSLVRLNTVIAMDLHRATPSHWLLKAAFGIYLGWICVATIANITTWLVSIGWTGWGLSATIWTIGVIAVGSLISSFLIRRFHNLFIGLSVIWAFTGIIIRQNQLHQDFTAISWGAVIFMIPILIAIFFSKTGR